MKLFKRRNCECKIFCDIYNKNQCNGKGNRKIKKCQNYNVIAEKQFYLQEGKG